MQTVCWENGCWRAASLAMTRAPLPGKLPEWPSMPDVLAHFYGKDSGAVPGAICELELATRQIAYWESRARLAVEALKTIEFRSNYLGGPHKQSWVEAHNALKAIGPLPEEDRT